MTISYRLINNNGDTRIEYKAETYGLEDLCESIWLHQIELRRGLPKNERIESQRAIALYQTLLDALRAGGA